MNGLAVIYTWSTGLCAAAGAGFVLFSAYYLTVSIRYTHRPPAWQDAIDQTNPRWRMDGLIIIVSLFALAILAWGLSGASHP